MKKRNKKKFPISCIAVFNYTHTHTRQIRGKLSPTRTHKRFIDEIHKIFLRHSKSKIKKPLVYFGARALTLSLFLVTLRAASLKLLNEILIFYKQTFPFLEYYVFGSNGRTNY